MDKRGIGYYVSKLNVAYDHPLTRHTERLPGQGRFQTACKSKEAGNLSRMAIYLA